MVWIAGSTVSGSSTTTLTFDNIPKTFPHIQFRVFGRGATAFSGGLSIYTNPIGMTNSALRRHALTGNGSSASSTTDAGIGLTSLIADGGATANVFANVIVDILDWASTTKNMTIRGIGGYDSNGSGIVSLSSGLIVPSGGTLTGFNLQTDGVWIAGSRIDLYGITTSSVTGA